MKTIQIEIELYRINELSDSARFFAISEHRCFMESLREEPLEDNDVLESIEINEYFFYKSGELAHTITYTKDSNLAGLTVYINNGKEYKIEGEVV